MKNSFPSYLYAVIVACEIILNYDNQNSKFNSPVKC